MTFSSFSYLIFFSALCLILLTAQLPIALKSLKKETLNHLRHCVLLVASYVFYGWWDWRFCFLMLLLTIISYLCALLIEKGTHKKLFLSIGVVFPLLVLAVFKYFNFFLQSFASLFQIHQVHALRIILPVGISFYTFQALSYIIDVYRGKTAVSHSFVKLALYIAFFPQLVAGPIVKANEFLPQLDEDRTISLKNFEHGIQIFVVGLSKKIVLADRLSVFVDDVFAHPLAFDSVTLLFAVVSYSLQIYFDFSGYSDMAIGSAKCLGYDLRCNFHFPYLSENISEFWKRWHISLSTWLQEYLYIPLGGNRKGVSRTYLNLMITMVLGGLWHGANWTFVLWGAIHGMGLCIHKIYRSQIKPSAHPAVVHAFSTLFTYFFVCFCWIFFRADTLQNAVEVIEGILCGQDGIVQFYSWSIVAIVLLLLFSSIEIANGKPLKPKQVCESVAWLDLNRIGGLFLFFTLIGLILGLAYTGDNPFIYFQF